MIGHLVHAAYEAVDKTAELAAAEDRPNEDLGKALVWLGAILGACFGGGSMLAIYQSSDANGVPNYDEAFTAENLFGIVFVGCLGALAGGCIGLLIWVTIVLINKKARGD